jgi:hypothetical protein
LNEKFVTDCIELWDERECATDPLQCDLVGSANVGVVVAGVAVAVAGVAVAVAGVAVGRDSVRCDV